MTQTTAKPTRTDEQGNILLIVLMILLLITLIGLSAIDDGVNELRIARFDRVEKRNFYNAEAGLYDAAAGFERIYTNSSDADGNRLYPLTEALLPLRDQDIETAGVSFASPLKRDGIPVAWIEVRSVLLKANQQSAGLSARAEQVPSMRHIGPAPDGFDESNYRSRHYAISATAIDPLIYDADDPGASLTNVTIQAGVRIAEETSKVLHLTGL